MRSTKLALAVALAGLINATEASEPPDGYPTIRTARPHSYGNPKAAKARAARKKAKRHSKRFHGRNRK